MCTSRRISCTTWTGVSAYRTAWEASGASVTAWGNLAREVMQCTVRRMDRIVHEHTATLLSNRDLWQRLGLVTVHEQARRLHRTRGPGQ